MTKAKPVPSNPLICADSADTLDYCAAVIAYAAKSSTDDVLTESYEFGRFLVLMTVHDALIYEAKRGACKHVGREG